MTEELCRWRVARKPLITKREGEWQTSVHQPLCSCSAHTQVEEPTEHPSQGKTEVPVQHNSPITSGITRLFNKKKENYSIKIIVYLDFTGLYLKRYLQHLYSNRKQETI